MSKRARDDLIELKFPIPGKRQAERKHKWYNAAWFIAETYTLNPKKNINEEKAAVEEEWRNFGLSTWPECIDDTMLALQTPRVRRLWADLWLQYATYTHASSLRLPPVQQMVSWAFRDIDKVAVLFGHPGLVIWVPFYGDIVLRDLKYTRIDDGIRALNPQVPITPYIVESVFLHIVWSDYWAESEGDISSFIDRELLSGGEMHEESGAESLFIEDDLSFGTVMTIPEVANSYEEFNTACHYLNPRSSITREQVYESYRWLLTLKSGLTGYPLVEALKGALPTNMDAYHDAVKKVGARLSKQILDDGAALSREPDKRFFSITYASHRMLKTTTTLGILPLVRFSFTPPPADRQLKKKVMADFAQQYRMLNAGVKLTKVDVDKAWRVILDAPLSAPAAGFEAAPDDTVAEKPPPGEDSKVRQSRGDEVQGLAEGPAAAGDESDTSQISTFEGLCRAASRREWRRERAAAAAAVEKAKAGDSSEVGARV